MSAETVMDGAEEHELCRLDGDDDDYGDDDDEMPKDHNAPQKSDDDGDCCDDVGLKTMRNGLLPNLDPVRNSWLCRQDSLFEVVLSQGLSYDYRFFQSFDLQYHLPIPEKSPYVLMQLWSCALWLQIFLTRQI